jgi:hypothetical protein
MLITIYILYVIQISYNMISSEKIDNKSKPRKVNQGTNNKESGYTRTLFPLSISTDEDKKLMKVYDHIIFSNEDVLIDRSYTTLALIRGFVSTYYDTIKSGKQLVNELKTVRIKPIIDNNDDNGIPIILPPSDSMRKIANKKLKHEQHQQPKKI